MRIKWGWGVSTEILTETIFQIMHCFLLFCICHVIYGNEMCYFVKQKTTVTTNIWGHQPKGRSFT